LCGSISNNDRSSNWSSRQLSSERITEAPNSEAALMAAQDIEVLADSA